MQRLEKQIKSVSESKEGLVMGKTWDAYKAFVSEMTKKREYYMFRGQSNSSWGLQTSFHRSAEGTNISIGKYLDFLLFANRYISASTNEIMDLSNQETLGCFLSLLQHHGFPTPLLDWTLSPYIAAYFALREVGVKSDNEAVKIYIFDYLSWTKVFPHISDLKSPDAYISIILPHARYNPRLIPQQGAFTFTNQNFMNEYIEEKEKDTLRKYLYNFKININEKMEILEELRLMGITEMSLFPGLDGTCRTLKHILFAKHVEPGFAEYLKEVSK